VAVEEGGDEQGDFDPSKRDVGAFQLQGREYLSGNGNNLDYHQFSCLPFLCPFILYEVITSCGKRATAETLLQ
jgi:hypothetical protein